MIRKTLAVLAIALYPSWVALPAWADSPDEDDSSWDCRTMGNRICGPDNDQEVSPGQYDASGVLDVPWNAFH